VGSENFEEEKVNPGSKSSSSINDVSEPNLASL